MAALGLADSTVLTTVRPPLNLDTTGGAAAYSKNLARRVRGKGKDADTVQSPTDDEVGDIAGELHQLPLDNADDWTRWIQLYRRGGASRVRTAGVHRLTEKLKELYSTLQDLSLFET